MSQEEDRKQDALLARLDERTKNTDDRTKKTEKQIADVNQKLDEIRNDIQKNYVTYKDLIPYDRRITQIESDKNKLLWILLAQFISLVIAGGIIVT
jgi:uncharacterized membrane protein